MYFLKGNSGIYSNQEILLETGSTIVLGRDAALAQIVLDDQMISGGHARLEVRSDGVALTDTNSTNGTFLDSGERLSPDQPYILKPGEGFYLADKTNSFVIIENDAGWNEKNKNVSRKENLSVGFSIVSLVTGILAAILCIAHVTIGISFIFAAIAGVLGLVFGIVSFVGKAKGKPIAVTGSILGAITLVTIVGMFIFKIVRPEEAEISGVYVCKEYDIVSEAMAEEIEKAAEKSNISSSVVKLLVQNLFLDGQATFTFLEDGRILIAPYGKTALEFGIFSWADAGDDNLFITLDLSDVQIAGCSFPIKLSYRTEYELTSDTLSLNLFGEKITLERIIEKE